MKSAIGISLRKMGCSFNFYTVLQVVSIIPLRHENYLLCALQNRRNVRLIIRQPSFNRFRHLSLPFIPSIAETLEFCITTGYPFRHA